MPLGHSELILNADGSIYHLNLLPEDIAHTIITVGDPERVTEVSNCFDTVEIKKGKREFLTHTGHLNGKRLTVISTGIGTDNIDIVLNELDALANIDFQTRLTKENRIRFKIVRIGTSGAIQPDIPIDSFLMSEFVIGFDGLLYFYKNGQTHFRYLENAFIQQTDWNNHKARPYILKCSSELGVMFNENRIRLGFTATNTGFYGPQGRSLRIEPSPNDFMQRLMAFEYENLKITNLEMETSGIYAMAHLLGHDAISLNCILANRATGKFSNNPSEAIHKLIEYTLNKLTSH
ncbi:nucleoside phosphorylase [Maribacter sp. 2210JD10-5]|uniref:nucleoside phosphorylase n=1 Tax=Maribacter sp. 2210JD10-5 TaxID=3386272 RepID=UPI0039BCB926